MIDTRLTYLKAKIYFQTTDIAAMITLAYADLGDISQNATHWQAVAFRELDTYKKHYAVVARSESYRSRTITTWSSGPITYGGGEQTKIASEFDPELYAAKMKEIQKKRREIQQLLQRYLKHN